VNLQAWLLSIAIVLGGVAWWRHSLIDEGYAKCKAETIQSIQIAQEKANVLSKQLQANAYNAAKEKQKAIADINARNERLVDSLRERPNRPDPSMPAASRPSSSGATGAELYREDAEFLAREAARADKQRASVIECQSRFENK
jgi:hypothetical protein